MGSPGTPPGARLLMATLPSKPPGSSSTCTPTSPTDETPPP
ncbi:hypothetical protein ACP70R_010482 [Stipagrostis hirtigluma subsp. patula]